MTTGFILTAAKIIINTAKHSLERVVESI
jgi:hypothetical protein